MNIIWFNKFKRKVKKCLFNKKIKLDDEDVKKQKEYLNSIRIIINDESELFTNIDFNINIVKAINYLENSILNDKELLKECKEFNNDLETLLKKLKNITIVTTIKGENETFYDKLVCISYFKEYKDNQIF